MEIGGTESMVAGAFVSGLLFALLAAGLQRRVGWVAAWSWCGLAWWLVVIALVTLVPLYGIDLAVPAETRSDTCSLDYGGPAPEGFWIFSGGQRLLNTALFVPAGALLVVASARWRIGWVMAPLGLFALAAYSLMIELVQLELARIDRACDVTDLVDNVIGAAIGFAAGLLLSVVLRPWRRR
ncbi:VanZ family protein [Nocardioides euryhalodurans]|uniref:VanZ family protein n=1 Tax=Nocardioides euryhalodurans TaxID=2518370 RepID=A0A4V1BE19_9ACTN|nr:VanZ family protein [Nocardioides euryhalodurans]QBR93082.1 VanZ family protein [Nocardioides euryhalodurans]